MTAPAIAIPRKADMVRICSMWQPWATLCVAPPVYGNSRRPLKVHETRAWWPRYPLPLKVAIHATRKGASQELLQKYQTALEACGYFPGRPLPYGYIIGVATIVAVKPTAGGKTAASAMDKELGDWCAGRWAWEFADVVALPHWIPHTGQQTALLMAPLELQQQIAAQLREVGR